MSEHIIENIRTARILNETAHALRTYGWIKGQNMLRDADGAITGFCLSGALTYVIDKYNCYSECNRPAEQALQHFHGDYVRYNDDPLTTFEDILSLLTKAQEYVLTGAKL